MKLRDEISAFLKLDQPRTNGTYEVLKVTEGENFERHLIQYQGTEEDEIRAYLFIPKGIAVRGGVLVHHQHHGERHLGKSEVSGLIGDPNQFFCTHLCEKGLICLAPDSICFEDRRTNKQGLEPSDDPEDDWLQHYNEMCYRLLRQETLMKKVLEDASIAVDVLENLTELKGKAIGVLGHSYGGNTVIFQSALDQRLQYSCTSGAVCSYKTKFENGTGIEMAEVIPGFVKRFDIDDLLKCIAPRKLLIMSSTDDQFSQDAQALYESLKPVYESQGLGESLFFKEYEGGHGLTPERFQYIIDWFAKEFSAL